MYRFAASCLFCDLLLFLFCEIRSKDVSVNGHECSEVVADLTLVSFYVGTGC